MSIATTWGSTPDERALDLPCDRLLPGGEQLYRGVTVHATPGLVYRWLCQLRVAPYSYDWLDNRGRRSPQELTPGLEDLRPGQRVMGSFVIACFEPDRHITLRLRPDAFEARFLSDVAVTYAVIPAAEGCRLVVKILLQYPPAFLSRVLRPLIAWGDLIMMRRQLLNVKGLAERQRKESGATP